MATNWRYNIDFLTAPALGVALLLHSLPTSSMKVSSFALGYLLWVMIEWFVHAKLLHRTYRREHWVHHRRPSDTTVNEQLPWTATHAAMGLVTALSLYLGEGFGAAFAGALVLGYASYIWGHHAMHQEWVKPSTPFLGAAVRRHELHHRGVEANFNVLCPLGDHLMGTFVKA